MKKNLSYFWLTLRCKVRAEGKAPGFSAQLLRHPALDAERRLQLLSFCTGLGALPPGGLRDAKASRLPPCAPRAHCPPRTSPPLARARPGDAAPAARRRRRAQAGGAHVLARGAAARVLVGRGAA